MTTDTRGGRTPTSRAIERWLVTRVAQLLALQPDDVDVRQPFAYYGIDSADSIALVGELEEWLGHRLSATLLWDYPTIGSVADHLAGMQDGRRRDDHPTQSDVRSLQP